MPSGNNSSESSLTRDSSSSQTMTVKDLEAAIEDKNMLIQINRKSIPKIRNSTSNAQANCLQRLIDKLQKEKEDLLSQLRNLKNDSNKTDGSNRNDANKDDPSNKDEDESIDQNNTNTNTFDYNTYGLGSQDEELLSKSTQLFSFQDGSHYLNQYKKMKETPVLYDNASIARDRKPVVESKSLAKLDPASKSAVVDLASQLCSIDRNILAVSTRLEAMESPAYIVKECRRSDVRSFSTIAPLKDKDNPRILELQRQAANDLKEWQTKTTAIYREGSEIVLKHYQKELRNTLVQGLHTITKARITNYRCQGQGIICDPGDRISRDDAGIKESDDCIAKYAVLLLGVSVDCTIHPSFGGPSSRIASPLFY